MYRPIPCSNEELYPTRWISRPPSRGEVAKQLVHLRRWYGTPCAKECRSRMIWVGIYPVTTTQQRELRNA